MRRRAGRALVAVGGYGRGELHPVLRRRRHDSAARDTRRQPKSRLSDFVTALWDVGLEIGHSVRTVAQCVDEAARTSPSRQP